MGTLTPLQVVGPNFGKLGSKESPNDIIESCFEAVNHPTLHHTFHLNVYEVLENLHILI
jgi:hypothetical protein